MDHAHACAASRLRPRLLRVLACALGTFGALLAAAPIASAAYELTVDPGFTKSSISGHLLGQWDQNGVLYTLSGSKLIRYDAAGNRLHDISLPTGMVVPRDVAPSPDGKYLYASQGLAVPVRLVRNEAGDAYTLDRTWKLDKFTYWGTTWDPVAHALQTDGHGDIYVSVGSFWVANYVQVQTSVAKYHADGSFVTAFGDYGKQPGNWIVNQDITVSRDGRRVYVGENCGVACNYEDPAYQASRITRYDYVPGGTYKYTRILSAQGAMDGNPFPRCQSAGATHSAYSITMDVFENLYATSTTCGRLQMFKTNADPAKDKFVKSIAVYTDPSTPSGVKGFKNHYIVSDWIGRVFAYEWGLEFTPSPLPTAPALPLPAVAPLPEPDVEAPVIATVTIPAITTSQDVKVATTASDNLAVAEIRFANEDGFWGPWQPFAAEVTHRLSDGYSVKGVYVQVRDMAGNTSNSVYRTTRYQADDAPPPGGDAADPIVTRVTIPALTATQAVDVGIEASDDVALRNMRFANEDGNWGAWQPFKASTSWQLSAGFGPKAVYVQVSDTSGKTSNTVLVRTKFQQDAPPPPPPGGQQDLTAPVLRSMSLPAETTTRAVTISLDATDDVGVSQVRFANEDGNWTGWQAYATQKQWTLSDGYTNKLVYAQVRDAAGRESLVLTARSRYVKTAAGPADLAAPSLTAVTIPNPTPTANVTITLAATDDVGVTQVRFANEDGNWGAWQAFAAEVPHTLTPGNTYKVVYAQVRDAAGRESNVLFAKTLVKP